MSSIQVGAIVTGTLLGSALMTLGVSLLAHRLATRALLLSACGLMVVTGAGFAACEGFVPLLVLAVLGTLNPTAGDVSVFLPLEQSQLADAAAPRDHADLFARTNVVAACAGALGALASACPEPLARASGATSLAAMRTGFVVYALAAIAAAGLYAGLPRRAALAASRRRPLERSRGVVLPLAALFTLDAFGGGFVVQSMLALWLFRSFEFSLAEAAVFFSVAVLLAGASQLLSPRLAERIGLVRTMAYTHLPANACLLLAALMPSAPLAIGLLLLRTSMSSMDVPVRQAFVMSVVPPEERAAAAGVTNVPRSLGGGLAPLLAGWLLARSHFGWPLVIAGTAKIAYDLILLARFRRHEPGRAAPDTR